MKKKKKKKKEKASFCSWPFHKQLRPLTEGKQQVHGQECARAHQMLGSAWHWRQHRNTRLTACRNQSSMLVWFVPSASPLIGHIWRRRWGWTNTSIPAGISALGSKVPRALTSAPENQLKKVFILCHPQKEKKVGLVHNGFHPLSPTKRKESRPRTQCDRWWCWGREGLSLLYEQLMIHINNNVFKNHETTWAADPVKLQTRHTFYSQGQF